MLGMLGMLEILVEMQDVILLSATQFIARINLNLSVSG